MCVYIVTFEKRHGDYKNFTSLFFSSNAAQRENPRKEAHQFSTVSHTENSKKNMEGLFHLDSCANCDGNM